MVTANYTPERTAKGRQIVRLATYRLFNVVVYGEHHAGLQYRTRHGLSLQIREALTTKGYAYAYAKGMNRDGRWRIGELAPDQAWR